jgi:hypothetical protein
LAVFLLRCERLVVRLVKDMGKAWACCRISDHPQKGDHEHASRAACWRPERTRAKRPGRCNPVDAQTYEITFLGQASTTLRTEFEDCEVTIGPGTTTVRAELPDRGALSGLMERINSLGLDVIDVSMVAPPPGK